MASFSYVSFGGVDQPHAITEWRELLPQRLVPPKPGAGGRPQDNRPGAGRRTIPGSLEQFKLSCRRWKRWSVLTSARLPWKNALRSGRSTQNLATLLFKLP